MLEITVDLVPYGDRGLKRNLGFVEIINDGTGDLHSGNYKYKVHLDGETIHEGQHFNFPRLEKNVYQLMQAILNEVYRDEIIPRKIEEKKIGGVVDKSEATIEDQNLLKSFSDDSPLSRPFYVD
jgi:hypothetical protein